MVLVGMKVPNFNFTNRQDDSAYNQRIWEPSLREYFRQAKAKAPCILFLGGSLSPVKWQYCVLSDIPAFQIPTPLGLPLFDYLMRVLIEEMESASANTRDMLDQGKSLAESQFVLVIGEAIEPKELHPRLLQEFDHVVVC